MMMMLFEEVGCNLYRSGNICRRLIEKRMGGRVKYIL